MSSMEVISRWIWSRSNGVMNVLCSRVMVSWVILSAARSAASMRRACASSSLNVPIIDASSRLPSTMRSAWALNRSKNLPSRGIRRPSIVIPLSRGPAILAVSLRGCRIPSRPARAVVLRGDFANLQFGKQLLEKLVLDGADGNVFAILGLVDVVPGRAGVEDIARSLLRPVIGGKETREHRGKQRCALDHRGVDHLTAPRALRFEQRAGDAEAEQHAAAAEVAHQVERRHRRLAFASESVQHAGEGDVVDVVAGARRERPALAPAGHAAVNQARGAFQTFMRT